MAAKTAELQSFKVSPCEIHDFSRALPLQQVDTTSELTATYLHRARVILSASASAPTPLAIAVPARRPPAVQLSFTTRLSTKLSTKLFDQIRAQLYALSLEVSSSPSKSTSLLPAFHRRNRSSKLAKLLFLSASLPVRLSSPLSYPWLSPALLFQDFLPPAFSGSGVP